MPLPVPRATLERLFTTGRLTRRQFIAGLAATGLSAGAIELLVGRDRPPPLPSASTAARFLCLIVLDGFRPDYLQLTPMPAYVALARRGTVYDRAWVGQLESETPVGHATLATGALPRRDGVIGFEWRDPVTRREVLDGWEQGSLLGQIGRDMSHSHATSIPAVIKAADPRARVVAVSSEKVYAADAMGARTADFVLYHRYGAHGVVPAGLPGQLPPPDFFRAPDLSLPLPFRHFTDWDDLSTALALTAFHHYLPRALMINLPGSDVYGHQYAGPHSPGVMAQVVAGQDRAIGRIVAAYREAGLLDETLFVITADHAMVPNNHAVGPDQVHDAVQQTGARYLFHTGGTAKYLYLRPGPHPRGQDVAAALADLPNVVAGYYRDADGVYQTPGPPERQLDAAYRYLLSTFNGPTAPDVVAPYRENTIGTAWSVAYGNHGGLSWGVQHIPLLLAGPGVRRGVRSRAPARLVDIAPTILRLLGCPTTRLDGTILADALEQPSAAEIAAQLALTRSLAPHQDALIAQADANRREDRRNGVRPPPRIVIRP